MDYTVHGIHQARILEWIARGSFQPRDWTQVSHIAGRFFFTSRATRKVQEYWSRFSSVQFSSVQSLSHAWLSATPWIATCQVSLSITNSQSLLKLMPIESVMPSSHLLLSRPNPSQHQGLFQWVSSSHEVAKVLEFQLQHQSFQWTPRTDL